jgi:4a-hydroxytetrahydrobiopterin dehydratase
MENELLNKKCIPCEGNAEHLMVSEIEELQKQIPGWEFEEFHHLAKTFSFKDFKQALDFTNKVGALAESEGHHPDIELSWGKVKIKLFTHAVDGLSENDFILAAKIDQIK